MNGLEVSFIFKMAAIWPCLFLLEGWYSKMADFFRKWHHEGNRKWLSSLVQHGCPHVFKFIKVNYKKRKENLFFWTCLTLASWNLTSAYEYFVMSCLWWILMLFIQNICHGFIHLWTLQNFRNILLWIKEQKRLWHILRIFYYKLREEKTLSDFQKKFSDV